MTPKLSNIDTLKARSPLIFHYLIRKSPLINSRCSFISLAARITDYTSFKHRWHTWWKRPRAAYFSLSFLLCLDPVCRGRIRGASLSVYCSVSSGVSVSISLVIAIKRDDCHEGPSCKKKKKKKYPNAESQHSEHNIVATEKYWIDYLSLDTLGFMRWVQWPIIKIAWWMRWPLTSNWQCSASLFENARLHAVYTRTISVFDRFFDKEKYIF